MVWRYIKQLSCCPPDSQERKTSKAIDKKIKNGRKDLDSEIKILLLGAGESGKSTLAKQMRIIHLQGYDEQERQTFKPVIVHNIVESMQILIRECKTKGVDFQDKEAAERMLNRYEDLKVLTKEAISDVKVLWADPGVQQIFRNPPPSFYIMDNIAYYADSLDRITAEGFIPNDEDILKARATTSGIYETEFDFLDAHFRMIDVGGQRTERKKWIHYFAGVTAVVFCVAMSEYDQVLLEDGETPRMHESLALFKDVCHSHWFQDTAIILFLNKADIFTEKITRVPLTVCFPEYDGLNEAVPAREYIKKKFTSAINDDLNKAIYPHFTTATDTQNIMVVFRAVRDMILRIQLTRNGMM